MILGQTLCEEHLDRHLQGVEAFGAGKGLGLDQTRLRLVKESLKAFQDCPKTPAGERLAGTADKRRVHEKSPR
jgi:hypothetical protein